MLEDLPLTTFDSTTAPWLNNVEYLSLNGSAIESMNLSAMPKLYELKANNMALTTLDILKNAELKNIHLENNLLTQLNMNTSFFAGCAKYLWLDNNPFTEAFMQTQKDNLCLNFQAPGTEIAQ